MLNPSKLDEIFGSLTWNSQIPNEYKRPELKTTGLDWKKIGNEHFASKRFNESVTAYTNGIDTEKSTSSILWLDLLSNRSAAYLRLGMFSLALADAQSVLQIDETHIKCLFRKASAFFGMAQYEDAVGFLSNVSLEMSNENRKIIDDLILKGRKLSAQSRTGDYSWKDICRNVLQDHYHDLAEYKVQSTVVVKDTTNKG